MREKLFHRCPKVNRDKVSVINNWINENNVVPYAFDDDKVSKYAKKYDVEGKLTIMYSGNSKLEFLSLGYLTPMWST